MRRPRLSRLIDRYGLDRTAILEVAAPGWDAGRIDEALWTELVGRYYQLSVVALWFLAMAAAIAERLRQDQDSR